MKKENIEKRRKLYKKMTACGLAAVMLFSGTLPDGEAQTVQAASEPAAQYNLAENGDMTYIAVMKNDASYDRVMEKAENMDALPEEQPQQLEQNNIAVLEMDSADADQIKQTQGVVALEEDVIFTANEEVPFNEAEVEALVDAQAELPFSQWNLDAVNLPDSLDLTGDTVRVAVLDSGVTAAEDVLVADYVDLTGSNNENPFFNDGTGHGTSIASLIGATGIGDMDGIAPGADIYDVKVLDGSNTAPLSKIIEGIYWCIDNDMDIINMSFGTTAYSASLEQAIDAAVEDGIIVVAAAGNNGAEAANIDYPAAFDNVISVGASNGDNAMTDFTSRGEGIDILAPGEKIWSYGAFAGLQTLDGTSIATAHVTGAAALLLERYPAADTEFIRQLLMASANQETGGSDLGILNIGDALAMADTFQVQDAAVKITPQTPSVTTYDTSGIVSGSWGGQKHHDMVSVLGNSTLLKIAANSAALVDDIYHKDDSRIECRALHARYNYVVNLHFLYEVALNGANIKLGDPATVTNYVNSINVQHSMDKTYGDSDLNNLRTVLIDACSNPDGLGKHEDVKVGSKDERRYMILGMAAHLIGDTFAHRTMIPEGLTGGSSRGSKTFATSHFKNWNDFYDRYQKTYVEFRDISKYLKSGQKNLYTDRVDFLPNRFEASKDGVANLFKRFNNGNGFSASKFFLETGFAKKLNNLNGYMQSAGEGAIAGNLSTSNYRVDAADGKIATNEKDYVDYNHSIYNQ